MVKHNQLLIYLIHLSGTIYIIMTVFNALAGIGYDGLFNQSVGNVSNKYTVYITPAGFTFSIWSVIYIFLGLDAIYCVSTVYRKSASRGRIYLQRFNLNWLFYLALCSNYALNTAWIFIWDQELIVAAAIFLLFIAYTGWIAFAVACLRGKLALENERNVGATNNEIYKEVRIQRILIHNGIALYTTWTTIASLLNLNIVFQYVGKLDPETISLTCSGVLLAIIVGWFIMENVWLDSYVRYTITQYPVVIFAVSGILSKQADPTRPDGPVPTSVQILTWVILGIAIGQFIARILIVLYRHKKQPLFKVKTAPLSEQETSVENK